MLFTKLTIPLSFSFMTPNPRTDPRFFLAVMVGFDRLAFSSFGGPRVSPFGCLHLIFISNSSPRSMQPPFQTALLLIFFRVLGFLYFHLRLVPSISRVLQFTAWLLHLVSRVPQCPELLTLCWQVPSSGFGWFRSFFEVHSPIFPLELGDAGCFAQPPMKNHQDLELGLCIVREYFESKRFFFVPHSRFWFIGWVFA